MEQQVEVRETSLLDKLKSRMESLEKLPLKETCILLIDSSGSMNDYASANQTKIAAVGAALSYLQVTHVKVRYAVVSFNYNADVHISPTLSFSRIVAEGTNFRVEGGTYISKALRAGRDLLTGVTTESRRMILLSDGCDSQDDLLPLDREVDLCAEDKVVVDTIGFGKDCDKVLLKEIAVRTGGCFYFCDTPASLSGAYQKLNYEVRFLGWEEKKEEVISL